MSMKLAQKVVVVTGGGAGIGRELVLESLRRGARVVAVDRNEAALAETSALALDHAPSLATFTVDITDRATVEGLVGQVVKRFGVVDGVVNCAGIIQPFVRFAELDYDVIDRVFEVNWRGTLYMTKAFLPSLLARPEAHLVNISSMGGFLPFPGQTIYGASKAAVKLLTEGLQSELAQTSVRVSLVFPGAIATNIAANSGVKIRDLGPNQKLKPLAAPQAARDILDGVERDQCRILVGKDAKFLDALYRIAPTRAAAFIAKQMKDLLL